MSRARCRRGRLLAPLLLAAAILPVAPAAAALKPAAKMRVSAVAPTAISVRWKDRSSGESRYEVAYRTGAGAYSSLPLGANAERATVGGLVRGTVYELRVRACRQAACAAYSNAARQATLLAPFNGPHPDPQCAVFPPSDEFNHDVSADPVDPHSNQIIARILADGGGDLHPDFGSNPHYGIPYVVVPNGQPGVPIRFGAYGDESDPGPYPIPPGAPIEGGVSSGGDRHVLIVRRPPTPGGSCELFELYRSFEGGGLRNRWTGDSGALFDLGSPLLGQRPAGWTSADAAGLPIFPGLVTYEEAQSGLIEHAIRITFDQTRRAYLPPATHWASDSCNPYRPSMGMRMRLKASYDISGITGAAGVIATALRDYGVIVADNGSNFYISGSTDRRWNDNNLNQLKDIPGTAFEVVAPTTSEVTNC